MTGWLERGWPVEHTHMIARNRRGDGHMCELFGLPASQRNAGLVLPLAEFRAARPPINLDGWVLRGATDLTFVSNAKP